MSKFARVKTLQWCHNECDGISNNWHLNCLLNRLFRHRSKKTSKLCITGLCKGNSPVTGEFPTQRASNAENISIWWHHHMLTSLDGFWMKTCGWWQWLLGCCRAMLSNSAWDSFINLKNRPLTHWGLSNCVFMNTINKIPLLLRWDV